MGRGSEEKQTGEAFWWWEMGQSDLSLSQRSFRCSNLRQEQPERGLALPSRMT